MKNIVAFCILFALLTEPAWPEQAVPAGKGAPKPPQRQRISLTKVTVKKGTYRMGFEDKREPPETGFQAKVGADTFVFFDLAEHDKLEPDIDGMAMTPYPFIVGIPEKLLLKTGQYKVSFEEEKFLILDPDDLGAAQAYASEAAVMTDLRIRSAVRPVALDPKACVDCEKHCDYLKANRMADGSGGLASHQEDPGKSGYTPEGAEAGKGSDIAFSGTLTKSMLTLYASVWHAVPIVDSRLREFGVARKNGVTMIYFTRRDGFQEALTTQPPDGATLVMRAFGDGPEVPNPVPGTDGGQGCGFPLLIRLIKPYQELVSVELTDAAGRRVAGTFSSPAHPANPEWPTNSNCAAFVPSKQLAPSTVYRAKFKFREVEEAVEWSFTTGK